MKERRPGGLPGEEHRYLVMDEAHSNLHCCGKELIFVEILLEHLDSHALAVGGGPIDLKAVIPVCPNCEKIPKAGVYGSCSGAPEGMRVTAWQE